jgi:invasion protein IalB
MKRFFLNFILVVLVSLYGCATAQQNQGSTEPVGSQMQATSGETRNNVKPPDNGTAAKNTLFESKADSVTKMTESQNSIVRTSVEKKDFGDWGVECSPTGSDCKAILKVKNKAGEQAFGLMVQKVKKEGPGSNQFVTAWLPLGTYLPEHTKVFIGDQNEPFLLIAQYCSPQGCFAASKVPESVIAALKKQNSGKVTVSIIKYISNKKMTFSFIQGGFPEAYQYIMKKQ